MYGSWQYNSDWSIHRYTERLLCHWHAEVLLNIRAYTPNIQTNANGLLKPILAAA